jgi:diphthamide synthase (EF-2-diphthine--ammonia ligase)
MIDNHMDCIIIKVASYKLFEKHLNKTIKELQPYFMQLKEECGMNVCGEGGEY